MSQEVPLQRVHRHLHFDALVGLVRRRFGTIADHRREPTFSLADTLMAALAMFSLKDPSLLAFQRRTLDHNLRSVFGLTAIPSDSQMRAIIDEVGPNQIRPAFNDVLSEVHKAKVLEKYRFLGCFLVALDGVEHFSSKKVHCPNCMTRHHNDGSVSYYHQMLGAAIVHPDFPEVIALPPEPIQRQDGQDKNDCERNAARRWLKQFRKDHPKMPVIVIEDALSSNAPHVRDLQEGGFHFILGVKEGDHTHLVNQVVERMEREEYGLLEESDADTGSHRGYLFLEGLSLNESNPDVKVNFLQFVEIESDETETERKWSWITDLELNASNVKQVTRAGRARWKIENETFNTLKNQGYKFEHNFGHGEKNLSVVLALVMMIAFLIDQVQQKCNPLFQAAVKKKGARCAVWEDVRHLFASFEVSSMQEIYEAIVAGFERPQLKTLIKRPQGQAGLDDTS